MIKKYLAGENEELSQLTPFHIRIKAYIQIKQKSKLNPKY